MPQYRSVKLFDKNMGDLDEQVNEILERRKRELEEAAAAEAEMGEDFDAEDDELGYGETESVDASYNDGEAPLDEPSGDFED